MAFSFRAGTNWCHDFPKLARESGFYFNMHSARVRVDWNRISAIDIDKVIRERDFLSIDENINNVIDYCLESEYDIKILDPSFVKLFRLAQLSVEYLLYCKQYLDHSVIILKDELRQKIEQNVNMKKEMTTLEDIIKNLKERSREKCKLIETRVGDSSGEIYKCPHCPKTFVSAMFVNAHVARRHLYISDMRVSVSPMHEHYRAETEKLHNEIKTLKERLNQTERVIRTESDKLLDNTEKNYVKNTSEYKYDNKTESIQEQRKYQDDIKSLKSMLFDEIRAMREKEHNVNDNISEANIKTLITQQEKEIDNLRNQLLQTLTPGIENMEIKLQMQENYWKAKIENIESQHSKDIDRLTTELKTTQQAADRIKSEYASKVHDLEKQSMDQSNILVEQRKQLNCLSREITNSQTYDNCYEKEKSTMHSFQRPLLTKHGNADFHDNNEIYHKNLSRVDNDEIIIEDIGSESSQEHDINLSSDLGKKEYIFDKTDNLKSKNNTKLGSDISGTGHMIVKSNRKNLKKLENNGKIEDKVKSYRVLKDINEVNRHENIKDIDQNKTFTVKNLENISLNASNKHINIGNTERKKTTHIDDMRNSQKSNFLENRSVSSITESESISSTSELASDSGSATADDVTVKKYEISTVSFPNSKKISQENTLDIFNNRLRDLGIDPEWQGIPIVTFKQKMEILRHQQNINSKKLIHYNQIKQEILTAVLRKISANHNELKNTTSTKIFPSHKLVTHIKPKALKAFNSHKNNDEDLVTQKLENTTPATTPKLRLKQKIDLLPKKYTKDMTSMDESTVKKDWIDMCNTPKVISTLSKLSPNSNVNQDVSSTNSIDSREDIKQISSTKIIVSDNTACKLTSPMSKRHLISSKFSETDSDSIILPQDDSVVSLKDNKSVLKLTSGSVGSLVKKKVLFDLEDEKNGIPKDNQKKDWLHDNDWNISSFCGENGKYPLQKEINTGNIILKTAQSDKIAEISKKIQEQLSIARRPPVGSVETIIRPNTDLEDITNYNARAVNNTVKLIPGNPTQDVTSLNAKSSIFPQPAPRTLKNKDSTIAHHENNTPNTMSKYFDLDSDIEEILRIV